MMISCFAPESRPIVEVIDDFRNLFLGIWRIIGVEAYKYEAGFKWVGPLPRLIFEQSDQFVRWDES
jgi:hypothetical protein